MPDVPPIEELSALLAAELAARLAEAYRVIGELTARAEQLAVVNERLTAPRGRTRASGAQGFGLVVEAAVVGQPV